MNRPWLVATTGLPYSGKTSFAAALGTASGMRVIELDALSLERRLDVTSGASRDDWELTFAPASEVARSSLGSGQSVVIDWVNAGPADRRRGETWLMPVRCRFDLSPSTSTPGSRSICQSR